MSVWFAYSHIYGHESSLSFSLLHTQTCTQVFFYQVRRPLFIWLLTGVEFDSFYRIWSPSINHISAVVEIHGGGISNLQVWICYFNRVC